jgi:hypothetical protein
MSNRNKPWLLLGCALLLAAGPATAFDLAENVQAHGFVSQSLAYSSDNRVGGNSDDRVATDMREIGANLSWRANPDWLISGQVLSRKSGASDDGNLRLDYGQVDHTLWSDSNGTLGVRLGKIKNPYGFFNTTRDVAHTRPGIIMPQSIYLDRVRNFYLAAPGVAVYGNHVSDMTELAWTLGTMRFDADSNDLESLFLGSQQPGRFQGQNSWLGQAMADFEGGRWRLGLTLGEINMRFHPDAGSFAGPGESSVRPVVLSLEKNSEKWSLTGEYSEIKNSGHGYGIKNIDDSNTIQSWYLQGTWRPTPDWRVYLRRDEIYADKTDKNGVLGSASTGGRIPAIAYYAKDWTLGTRHDIGAWALSAEWHQVHGTFWLSPLDLPLSQQKADWNLLLLQAAWRF